MKSIMILCAALLFLGLSPTLSLLIYEQNSSAADILTLNVAEPGTLQDNSASKETLISVSWADAGPSDFHSGISQKISEQFAEITSTTNVSRRTIEPVSIFLFGAGLIGVAIFTRRKFNK